MRQVLIKGNEAVVKAAILSGCRYYFGYPITPASEIAHAAAKYFPLVGGTFLQAESEISAINMVYGASSTGVRVMTASSGPGISLKQEGISYMAGAELPCLIVDVMRAGPGLGNIWAEQGDYNQVVKGGGHGNYKIPVLAPASSQEMCDYTALAFDIADRYRTPVYLFTDAYIGQMMEPVDFSKVDVKKHDPSQTQKSYTWQIRADKQTRSNCISSIVMSPSGMEELNLRLQEKYKLIEQNETRFETYRCEDISYFIVAYGICSRLARSCVDKLRLKGIKIGMIRPQTLFPFPSKAIASVIESNDIKRGFVFELSNGQMFDDVALATSSKVKLSLINRMGGVVPSESSVIKSIEDLL